MRAVATPGRWVWGLSGLVTAAALVIPGTRLIASAGIPWHTQQPQDIVIRTVTVPQPVTSLTVQSYGAPVQVTAGPVSRVQVTETLMYTAGASGPQSAKPRSAKPQSGPAVVSQSGPPVVSQSVSDGHLSLADPACTLSACAVGFALTVPAGVTVTAVSDGGPVAISGTAGAILDSGGGPVRATRIGGPLTVSTGGGPLLLNGLAGALRADSAGGSLFARHVTAATAMVTTGGGDAWIAFSAAPDAVTVRTDGGSATLTVPGGPYALAADSVGGPEVVRIATDPAARRSITVTSGGGPLLIEPSSGRLPARGGAQRPRVSASLGLASAGSAP
jgi:hypothetical protein